MIKNKLVLWVIASVCLALFGASPGMAGDALKVGAYGGETAFG